MIPTSIYVQGEYQMYYIIDITTGNIVFVTFKGAETCRKVRDKLRKSYGSDSTTFGKKILFCGKGHPDKYGYSSLNSMFKSLYSDPLQTLITSQSNFNTLADLLFPPKK